MEATAQSVEDYLIDGLSFKLSPGASYITNRRSVTYHPSDGNDYSPTGIKVIRLTLTGDGWLDASTLRIMFKLNNTNTDTAAAALSGILYPISGPWSFFRRMRVLCGGQLIEDIDYYNRVHEMFHNFQSRDVRINDMIEGFGNNSTLAQDDYNQVHPPYTALNADQWNLGHGIPQGASEFVCFRPLSGLIGQGKMLPLRYAPITIELEVVNSTIEPVIVQHRDATPVTVNHSTSWTISEFQVKCDICSIDNALDNEYAQHLLSGKSLPISYSTYITQLQAIAGTSSIAVNVQRAFSRLKSIFISTACTGQLAITPAVANTRCLSKEWNLFYHPMNSVSGNYSPALDFEFQLQIGSKLFPEYPIRSTKEAFYQLRKCLGVHNSTFHSLDITPAQYQSYKHIIGIDTEKVLSAGFTGLNTKAGDLMTVKFNGIPTGNAAILPDKLYIVMHADMIMNIRDTGVEVLE